MVKSNLAITDVVGTIDPSSWTELLQTKCGVQTTEIHASNGEIPSTLTPAPRLIHLRLPAPSSESRAQDLASNDAFFATLLEMLPTQNYTVLYTTRRAREGWFNAQVMEPAGYEMESDIQESLHTDLKRNLGARLASDNKTENQTMIDGPLFDRYQFFTPGESSVSPEHCSTLQRLLMSLDRHLHGLLNRFPPPVYSVCGDFSRCILTGHIRCF